MTFFGFMEFCRSKWNEIKKRKHKSSNQVRQNLNQRKILGSINKLKFARIKRIRKWKTYSTHINRISKIENMRIFFIAGKKISETTKWNLFFIYLTYLFSLSLSEHRQHQVYTVNKNQKQFFFLISYLFFLSISLHNPITHEHKTISLNQ